MDKDAIEDLKNHYSQIGLNKTNLDPDPLNQFKSWFKDAVNANLFEPGATCLSTATKEGQPSARTVLLKGVDKRGFLFFSNYESRKAQELGQNPRAALVVAWIELGREICISGKVSRISKDESTKYFHTRPIGSQLSAWASPQSKVINNRHILEKQRLKIEKKFHGGKIPLPPFWGGYCLTPVTVEFWQSRPNRLHDRLRYKRLINNEWIIERLAP